MASRCWLVFLTIAVSVTSVCYYITTVGRWRIVPTLPVMLHARCPYQWPGHIHHTQQFKSFSDGSSVYSAYYDSRVDQNNVRIIGLADLDINSHLPTCILWYNQTDCDVMQASVYRVAGFTKYIKNPSSDYLCTPRPGQTPTHVTLTNDNSSSTNISLDATLPIGNTRPPQNPPHNLTVCVHEAFFGGYPDRNILIEFIEIYRMLGADKIVVYNATGSANITPVADYYVNEGILDVYSWHPPAHTKTHYYAQPALIQECMYRYMYQTRHLALVNLDEFIFPKKHDSLVNYLTTGQCKDADQIIFQNTFFPLNIPSQSQHQSNKSREGYESVVLRHTSREKRTWGYIERCKVVVRPRGITVGQVHTVKKLAPAATNCKVPTSDALLHHYSKWNYAKQPLIEDKSANRFLQQIHDCLSHAHSSIDQRASL